MKKIWVLLAIVLVLLFIGFREGLQSTSYADILASLGQTPGYSSPTGPTGPTASSSGSTGPTGPSGPTGGSTGPTGPAEPASASVLARKRPDSGDSRLRGEVASYAGTRRNDPIVAVIIAELQRFYDTVYVPNGKRMPTYDEIRTFTNASTAVPFAKKPALTGVLDYWFTEPASPMDPRVESTEATPGTPEQPGANTTGGSSVTNWGGGGGSEGRIWGPPFSGSGTPRNLSGGGDAGGGGEYPTLLGPPSEASAYWAGVGVVPPSKNTLLKGSLPSSASTGSDPMSGFLPYSRQPGDQDLVPDPYRVSQSFSAASYSSKNEPVPFLTDFSAFQK